MEFNEWFNNLREEKFPDLWCEALQGIDYYWYSYERDEYYLKEEGIDYVSFLENLIEEMYKDLMLMKEKTFPESKLESLLEKVIPLGNGTLSMKNMDEIIKKAKQNNIISQE